MFDYTIVAGQKVWEKIKRISFVLNIVAQAFTILYLLYICFSGSGVLPINIILLVLSAAYLAFYCVFTNRAKTKELRRLFSQIFKWSKRVIKLVNLSIMLYIFFSTGNNSALDTVLLALSAGLWVLDILFEIASIIVRSWAMLLFEGMKADFQTIAAPITATGNFFKRLGGKEVPEPTEEAKPNKNRLLLDKLVAERKEQRKENKALQRLEKKATKKAAKLAKKLLKSNPAPSILEETAVSDSEE